METCSNRRVEHKIPPSSPESQPLSGLLRVRRDRTDFGDPLRQRQLGSKVDPGHGIDVVAGHLNSNWKLPKNNDIYDKRWAFTKEIIRYSRRTKIILDFCEKVKYIEWRQVTKKYFKLLFKVRLLRNLKPQKYLNKFRQTFT